MLIENCDTPGNSHFLPCAPNFKSSKNWSPWKNLSALRLFLQGLSPPCLLQTRHHSHKHAVHPSGPIMQAASSLLSLLFCSMAVLLPSPPLQKEGEKTRTCPSPAIASLMHLPLGSRTPLDRCPCKNLGLPQSPARSTEYSNSPLEQIYPLHLAQSQSSASAFNWMTD